MGNLILRTTQLIGIETHARITTIDIVKSLRQAQFLPQSNEFRSARPVSENGVHHTGKLYHVQYLALVSNLGK